jgi:hypothetical protein
VTSEELKSVAELLGAIAWPALLLFVILHFREQFISLLTRLREVEAGSFKAKIERELTQSAEEAAMSEGRSKAPTPSQIDRAKQVELISKTNVNFVRQQVLELATEYERIRNSLLSPRSARIRAMEMVVAKMRTLGKAAYPLRYYYTQSPSPGHRLQAIACLQIEPDYELVKWLADRPRTEKRFVIYHALVALSAAASNAAAPFHRPELEGALQTVLEAKADSEAEPSKDSVIPNGSARGKMLEQFRRQIEEFRSQEGVSAQHTPAS